MVPNEVWNVDIFDMSQYKDANQGYRYLLACVDVFTRKAYVEPMTNKNSVAAREAFQSILSAAKAQPRSILIDNDAGFLSTDGSTGETFSKFLDGKQIAMQTNALKDHQAMSVIDNFEKRIKSVMNKMILRHNVATWYDKIQKIVDIYNNTAHSAVLDVKPDEVADDGDNQEAIVDVNIEKNPANHTTSHLKIGDKVRVNTIQNDANSKGTDPKWSGKVYDVQKIQGQTTTINDGMRHNRSDLLKVPQDAEEIPDNIIIQTKKLNTKETRRISAQNPVAIAKLKALLAKRKEEKANETARQKQAEEERAARQEADLQDQKDKEEAEKEKITPEQRTQLAKSQSAWLVQTRGANPPTGPYPWTLEHIEAIMKKKEEAAASQAAAAAVKAARAKIKAAKEKAAAEAKAAKKKK